MDYTENDFKKLRKPFKAHQIGKLPKPTKQQTEALKGNVKLGIRCKECQGWHHKNVVHLDYVGHAALTDRFLDVDPEWNWEPMAISDGLPVYDASGGLWIKLTLLGVTRMGYGNAENSSYKEVGSRVKEVIGDALRNAGMRFGCALDLWHKGDLHHIDEIKDEPKNEGISPAEKDSFQVWEKWIDDQFRLGLQAACKTHISKAKANQKIKEHYNQKLVDVKAIKKARSKFNQGLLKSISIKELNNIVENFVAKSGFKLESTTFKNEFETFDSLLSEHTKRVEREEVLRVTKMQSELETFIETVSDEQGFETLTQWYSENDTIQTTENDTKINKKGEELNINGY